MCLACNTVLLLKGVITMSWLMYIKMCQVRRSLKQKRVAQLELMQRQQRVTIAHHLVLSPSPWSPRLPPLLDAETKMADHLAIT